jgi:hypothetical protein
MLHFGAVMERAMGDGENREPGLIWTVQRMVAVPARWEGAFAALGGWAGRLSDMGEDGLKQLRADAVACARREVRRYCSWRRQEEPALPGGYAVEGIAHKALETLLELEVKGVPRVYSAEEITHELERLIKHLVWRLHVKAENRLAVSEWDFLPPRPDGELASILPLIPGRIAAPDVELMRKEERELLEEFRAGFNASLGSRDDLRLVFGRVWDGEKRREVARGLGVEAERVKHLTAQLGRRLREFCQQARGGMAEMLGSLLEFPQNSRNRAPRSND